ncbi:MAG: GAF domain-containing protein, partial [Pseudomonadota bacterium]
FGKGVCGTCAKDEKVQIVEDVDAFPGHIACSSSTRSEIVLPVYENKHLIGVLDIDSNTPADFDEQDAKALSSILETVF